MPQLADGHERQSTRAATYSGDPGSRRELGRQRPSCAGEGVESSRLDWSTGDLGGAERPNGTAPRRPLVAFRLEAAMPALHLLFSIRLRLSHLLHGLRRGFPGFEFRATVSGRDGRLVLRWPVAVSGASITHSLVGYVPASDQPARGRDWWAERDGGTRFLTAGTWVWDEAERAWGPDTGAAGESTKNRFIGGMRYPGRFLGSNATWPLVVLTVEGGELTVGLRRPFRWLDLFFPNVNVQLSDGVEAEVIRGIALASQGIRFYIPTLAQSLIFWCSAENKDRILKILAGNGVRIRPGVGRLI